MKTLQLDYPMIQFLTHNCLWSTPNSLAILEYFKGSEGTKISHVHSNQIHKIRFQDIAYLKLNKWAKWKGPKY